MTLSVETLVLRLKRPDTQFFRSARKAYDVCSTANMPVPSFFKPAGRLLYELSRYVPRVGRRFRTLLYTHPVFCCRCESVGKHLRLCAMPSVEGHTFLYIGDNVRFSGSLAIVSGKFRERPTLRIGNRVFLGHNVTITCDQEVVLEDDVLIAGNCKISDYDGHPASMEKRIARCDPDAEEIRPVRICKGAWIGFGVWIMKGVTIGEGSIVGAHSIVTHDVPPHCVVAGSPARVVKETEAPTSANIANEVSIAA